MSRFEDNLWQSVLDEHGDDLARADPRVTPSPRRTRPRVLAGATVAVAASATAVTLLLSATASPPAYAVTRHHDGSVSVRILRPSGIPGANRTLAALGIHAHLAAVRDGKPVPATCTLSSGSRVRLTEPLKPVTTRLVPAVHATTPTATTVHPKTITAVPLHPKTATLVPARPTATTLTPGPKTVVTVPVSPTRTTAPTVAVPVPARPYKLAVCLSPRPRRTATSQTTKPTAG